MFITIFEYVGLWDKRYLEISHVTELCATVKIRVQGEEVREGVRAKIVAITAFSRYQGPRIRGVQFPCFLYVMLSK